MKSIFSAVLLTGISVMGFTQTAMDKTIKNSCNCFERETGSTSNYDEYMALAVKCLSPELLSNVEGLKKELGITEKDPVRAMERVGEKVGQRLVMECGAFAKLTSNIMAENEDMVELVQEHIDKRQTAARPMIDAGMIMVVSESFPLTLTVKTESGESILLLVFDKITMDSSYQQNPSKLKGKQIDFVYESREIYDPVYKKFVFKKVLVELNVK